MTRLLRCDGCGKEVVLDNAYSWTVEEKRRWTQDFTTGEHFCTYDCKIQHLERLRQELRRRAEHS